MAKNNFPANLYDRDLMALYNILQLAKGDTRHKTIAEVDKEVRSEFVRRLNEKKDNGDYSSG